MWLDSEQMTVMEQHVLYIQIYCNKLRVKILLLPSTIKASIADIDTNTDTF